MKKHLVWLVNLPMVTLFVLLVGQYDFWSNTPGSEFYVMQYVWLALMLVFGLLGWVYYAALQRVHLLPHRVLRMVLGFCNYYTAVFPTVALFTFSNVLSDQVYEYSTHQVWLQTFSYYASMIFLVAQLMAIILLVIASYYQRRRGAK